MWKPPTIAEIRPRCQQALKKDRNGAATIDLGEPIYMLIENVGRNRQWAESSQQSAGSVGLPVDPSRCQEPNPESSNCPPGDLFGLETKEIAIFKGNSPKLWMEVNVFYMILWYIMYFVQLR